jgi:hypothetical protein
LSPASTPSKTLVKSPISITHVIVLKTLLNHHCHKQSFLLSLSLPFLYLTQAFNKGNYALTLA